MAVTTVHTEAASAVLAGQHVVFTGRLSSVSRREARQIVSRLGGTPMDDVTARTTMLVVGSGASAAGGTRDDGKSQKIRRAVAINAKDPGRVQVLTEDQFCALAGVPSPAALRKQWYALRDILAMYPHLREDHLRYLEKWKLVQPALRTSGETYFTFPDLAVIRQVNAELERGARFQSVLQALQANREGQMSLDFSLDVEPAKVIGLTRAAVPPPSLLQEAVDHPAAEAYFRDASALDDGDPRKHEAASRAYRRALEIDPWLVPAIVNLANIHYAREHLIESEVLYERAIALAPELFEAHFNLGNVYHDLGRLEEARACYEEALRLNPGFADGHFYLAVTLEKQGLSQQARPHWLRYRELEPRGEWVELAREFSE